MAPLPLLTAVVLLDVSATTTFCSSLPTSESSTETAGVVDGAVVVVGGGGGGVVERRGGMFAKISSIDGMPRLVDDWRFFAAAAVAARARSAFSCSFRSREAATFSLASCNLWFPGGRLSRRGRDDEDEETLSSYNAFADLDDKDGLI